MTNDDIIADENNPANTAHSNGNKSKTPAARKTATGHDSDANNNSEENDDGEEKRSKKKAKKRKTKDDDDYDSEQDEEKKPTKKNKKKKAEEKPKTEEAKTVQAFPDEKLQINCVKWNPRARGNKWLAFGGNSGFVRLKLVKL